MSQENFKKYLADLGEGLGIKDLAPDEENYCCLGFDDKIIVHLQYNADAQILMLFAQLGSIEKENAEELNAKILKANLFWQGTGGATIGVDDETQEALMCYQTPMKNLDYTQFQELMETFINTAEIWITTLEKVQSKV